MCQSRRSLLNSHWLHEKILTLTFCWLAPNKCLGKLVSLSLPNIKEWKIPLCDSLKLRHATQYWSGVTLIWDGVLDRGMEYQIGDGVPDKGMEYQIGMGCKIGRWVNRYPPSPHLVPTPIYPTPSGPAPIWQHPHSSIQSPIQSSSCLALHMTHLPPMFISMFISISTCVGWSHLGCSTRK